MNDSSSLSLSQRNHRMDPNATAAQPDLAENEAFYDNIFQWVTEGLLIFIVGIIGLVGNGISIWTFSRQRVHRIFHNLLLVLAIFDILYVVCSIHLFSLRIFWPDYDQMVRIPSLPVVIPFAQIGLMGSTYCTVALALERFLAVCYPFLPRRHVYSTRTFVIPVVVFTILYNVPKFFELTVITVPMFGSGAIANESSSDINATLGFYSYDNETETYELDNYTGPLMYELKPTTLRLDRLYIRVYILWMNLLLLILGPFIVIIILNFRVYRRIKQFEQTLLNDTLRVCFTRMPSANGGPTQNLPLHQIHRNSDERDRAGGHGGGGVDVIEEESGTLIRNGSTLFRGIRKRRRKSSANTPRRREVQLSKISIYIVFMFVICHSVRLIPNTYEMAYTYSQDYDNELLPWPLWVARVTNVSHVLLTLVCSSNFFIYYFKHGNICRKKPWQNRERKYGNAPTLGGPATTTNGGIALTEFSENISRADSFLSTSGRLQLSICTPLHFRTVNVPHLLERAPFGKRAKEIIQYIETSEKVTNHLSDALRLTLIYLYGGWYADLDTVTMKSLVDLDFDVLSTDTGSEWYILGRPNATSQLFLLSQREPLHFRTVNVPHLLERAPFGKRAKEIIQYIETSEKVTNHLSDALRLTLIYLYGGWYADLDTVTMKSLVDLDFDVLSTDTGSEVLMRLENLKFEESPNNTLLGKSVANGYFHFGEAQSDFIRKTILLFIHNFNPKIWNSGGAAIMTRMLRWQCGLKPKEKLTSE
eukprot:maker-scaffold237_size242172-snap-gene-1.31 protein:Tk05175 transcript:maker-scaffold237_size242172-snap-gene-1.31-mRNA-1 annotation:"fmrfamide receptor"